MEISGHRTRSVFNRYNIVSSRDLADAATKMEQRHNDALGKVTGKVAEEPALDDIPTKTANSNNLLN